MAGGPLLNRLTGGSSKHSKTSNQNDHHHHHHHHHHHVDVTQTIRTAIAQGAPLYNAGNKKGCYDIYLAAAYQLLGQETLHDVMKDHEEMKGKLHADDVSGKIVDLLTTSTTEARALIIVQNKDYDGGAWILRRAFDEIIKLVVKGSGSSGSTTAAATATANNTTSPSSPPLGAATEMELREQGKALGELCHTIEDVVEIKTRKYRLKSFEHCMVGKEAVDTLVSSKVFLSRNDCVQQLQTLLEIGLLIHVTKDHNFKDDDLFYRFTTTMEIDKCLQPYRNKAELLQGNDLRTYVALLTRYKQFHKHPSLGVIRLDYDYPPAPGDIDSPDSYSYPVYYRVVPGLSFQMCQSGKLTPAVAKAFDEAVLWLAEHRDVSTITGDCGFMMWFTERARNLGNTKKPILLSALMQLPTMIAACAPQDKIIVLTANGKSLMPMMPLIQETLGYHSMMDQIVICGCEDVPYFGEPVEKGEKVDVEKAQPGIVQKVLDALQLHPTARMILFECTELPPYSDAVREATRLPVYDSITQSDFAMNGFLDNSNFGLNGWYEPWDGIQEEYVLGQNLDSQERLQCVWCVNKEHEHKF